MTSNRIRGHPHSTISEEACNIGTTFVAAVF